MIFGEIYFSRHILLTDQISLADYLKDSFKKRRHIKNFQTLFQKYSSGGVPWKSFFLEISQNSQENTCANVSFLIKLQAWGFIKKETDTGVSGKFCKISKNTSGDCFCPSPMHHLSLIRLPLLPSPFHWGNSGKPFFRIQLWRKLSVSH